ncbi:hypothetical protein BsWGS_09881 [Bradybaena similaris]
MPVIQTLKVDSLESSCKGSAVPIDTDREAMSILQAVHLQQKYCHVDSNTTCTVSGSSMTTSETHMTNGTHTCQISVRLQTTQSMLCACTVFQVDTPAWLTFCHTRTLYFRLIHLSG